MGAAAGEEFVEQRAEGVHVGGRRDGLAADLLGRGVLRRHRAKAGPREPRPVVFEQARDAEVEELHLRPGLAVDDEDVRRLEVAVDDEAGVGVRYRVADPLEEGEARLDAERPRVAVRRDRLALDDLHREVRPAVVGEAAVEEPGDAGVREAGEDLPLLLEPPHDGLRVHPPLDELEGDGLLVRAVVPLGEVDDAHPAAAEFAHDAVRPHALVLHREHRREVDGVDGEALQQAVDFHIDEGGDLGVEVSVELAIGVDAGGAEEGVALGRRAVERGLEEGLDGGPACGIHRLGHTGRGPVLWIRSKCRRDRSSAVPTATRGGRRRARG